MLSLVSYFSFTKQVGLAQELERKGKKRRSCLTYQFWFGFPIWFPSQSDAKSLSSVSLTQLLVSEVVKQWSQGTVGLHWAHTRSTTSCYCNIHNVFLGFPWCAWTMVMNGRWYEDQANRPTKLTHALAFQNVWWLSNCAVGWKCDASRTKNSYWSNGSWHHHQCCQVLDLSPYNRLEVLLGNAAQGNKKTPQRTELSNSCSIHAGFIV